MRDSTPRPRRLLLSSLPPGTPTWGKEFKKALHQNFTRTFEIFCHATSLPVETNSFSLDPDVKDAWGLPALRMTFRDHPNDLKMMEWMSDARHGTSGCGGREDEMERTRSTSSNLPCTCWAPAAWATIRKLRSSIPIIARMTWRIFSCVTAAAWSLLAAASRR